MENRNLGLLIAAFIMVVIGASLIGVIATQEQTVTKTTAVGSEAHALTCAGGGNVTAETITLTNAPTGWKTTDCPLTNLAVKNSSGSAVTLTTDYTADLAAGTVTFKDTTANNAAFCGGTAEQNTSYMDYYYCSNEYVNLSWGRTVLDLVPGFFALAIMGIGIALFFGVMKNEGLLGL